MKTRRDVLLRIMASVAFLATSGPGVGYSHTSSPNKVSTVRCNPKGYSVEEGTEPGTHTVKIVQGGVVLHTIKLPTGADVNGFGFNGAKKTKDGFEISIEYGSRFYYAKRFVFVCRQHTFYLTKIIVNSFDKHNPEKWSKKVVRVRPNVPLEKFSVTDFMR